MLPDGRRAGTNNRGRIVFICRGYGERLTCFGGIRSFKPESKSLEMGRSRNKTTLTPKKNLPRRWWVEG